jgi:hypothetical protein
MIKIRDGRILVRFSRLLYNGKKTDKKYKKVLTNEGRCAIIYDVAGQKTGGQKAGRGKGV